MKRNLPLLSAVFGALTAGTVVALTYLGWRVAGLPFLTFDIFDWTARVLPGALVNSAIDLMVNAIRGLNLGPTASTAKLVEQSIAVVEFVLVGAIFGVLLAVFGRRRPERLVAYGVWGGLLLLAGAFLIEAALGFASQGAMLVTLLWLTLVLVAWGALLGRLLREVFFFPGEFATEQAGKQAEVSRRQFLYWLGLGSAAVVVTALGVSVVGSEEQGVEQAPSQAGTGQVTASAADTSGPAQSPLESTLAARIKPAPGTRPELTSNADFYRVDIDTVSPQVDGKTWRLDVSGLVEKPLSLSLDDIRARPPTSQVITLECISNPIGGDLISTGLWTGVSLKDILAQAGLKSGAKAINMRAADGYFESMPIEEAMDERTLLVYEMNGQPLPAAHGYPLRIYIPDHFGMKQPKWLTQMEVVDSLGPAYWVERGWSRQATVKTTSVIDVIDVNAMGPSTNLVPVGGIAFAGARGISKVEVQVDDGPWEQAELRDPPLSPLTWVQWRYDWKASLGRHTLRVRAYDGTGALQETRSEDPFPDGATGIDTKTTLVTG